MSLHQETARPSSRETARPLSTDSVRSTTQSNLDISTPRVVDNLPKSSIIPSLDMKYTGEKAAGKFHGKGEYAADTGGKYVGGFANGKFHGEGTLFVNKGKFEGIWAAGIMTSGTFIFDDGLNYKQTGEKYWDYCSIHDQRFQKEILENVPKAGPYPYKDVHIKPTTLPSNCYDCIEGYYDPKRKMIINFETGGDIRVPNERDIDWIERNCRKGALK